MLPKPSFTEDPSLKYPSPALQVCASYRARLFHMPSRCDRHLRPAAATNISTPLAWHKVAIASREYPRACVCVCAHVRSCIGSSGDHRSATCPTRTTWLTSKRRRVRLHSTTILCGGSRTSTLTTPLSSSFRRTAVLPQRLSW